MRSSRGWRVDGRKGETVPCYRWSHCETNEWECSPMHGEAPNYVPPSHAFLAITPTSHSAVLLVDSSAGPPMLTAGQAVFVKGRSPQRGFLLVDNGGQQLLIPHYYTELRVRMGEPTTSHKQHLISPLVER